MVVFVLILSVLLIFAAVTVYFFFVAFVRRKTGDLEDINHPANDVLEDYRTEVKRGLDEIREQPWKWVETVSFDRLKLCARYLDNGAEKTVILFHGYRSCAARDFSCAVGLYKSWGYNILLCDQRSHGRSQGRLITFGVNESRDVKTWVSFVIQKYGPQRILVEGISMGATTVLMACDDLPDTVKAVIADCGFTSPKAIIAKVARQNFHINGSPCFPVFELLCRSFGHFSFLRESTIPHIRRSKLPILFVHGKSDGFVPCSMSEEAFSAVRNPNSRLLTVEGADHGMSFLKDRKTVTREIKNFLEKNNC